MDYLVKDSNNDFFGKLQDILDIFHTSYSSHKLMLMGDINIDLLNTAADKTQNLVMELAGNGLSNHIHALTRICDTTATLIDHCWTNFALKNKKVLIDGVADIMHLMWNLMQTKKQRKLKVKRKNCVGNSIRALSEE